MGGLPRGGPGMGAIPGPGGGYPGAKGDGPLSKVGKCWSLLPSISFVGKVVFEEERREGSIISTDEQKERKKNKERGLKEKTTKRLFI